MISPPISPPALGRLPPLVSLMLALLLLPIAALLDWAIGDPHPRGYYDD